jgi:hypothetical protein
MVSDTSHLRSVGAFILSEHRSEEAWRSDGLAPAISYLDEKIL